MSDVVEVKVLYSTGWEGFRRETLMIDGKEVMYAGPLCECPEDAILERSLKGPSDFAELLESFLVKYKGKKVKFIYGNEEEDDEQ